MKSEAYTLSSSRPKQSSTTDLSGSLHNPLGRWNQTGWGKAFNLVEKEENQINIKNGFGIFIISQPSHTLPLNICR